MRTVIAYNGTGCAKAQIQFETNSQMAARQACTHVHVANWRPTKSKRSSMLPSPHDRMGILLAHSRQVVNPPYNVHDLACVWLPNAMRPTKTEAVRRHTSILRNEAVHVGRIT